MHIYMKFESYNLQSENLAHEGADFLCPKCSKTRLRASLIPIFSGG